MSTVTIVVPTFNRAALLPRAVASARLAGGDPEIIVVDDHSSDDTPSVARRLGSIRYIRLDVNVGLAIARNAGILASTSPFLLFLDDDDLIVPGALQLLLAALQAAPRAALAYGRYCWGDSTTCAPVGDGIPSEQPTGDIYWRLLEGNLVPVHAVLVRRASLARSGLFDPRLPLLEDWDLWLRLTAEAPVVAVPNVVAVYRRFAAGSGQMTSNHLAMCEETMRVQARALQTPRALAGGWRRRRDVRLRLVARETDRLVRRAVSDLVSGEWRRGARGFWAALGAAPLRSTRRFAGLLGSLAVRRALGGRSRPPNART